MKIRLVVLGVACMGWTCHGDGLRDDDDPAGIVILGVAETLIQIGAAEKE